MTAHSRREMVRIVAHPLPGPAPAREAGTAADPVRAPSMVVAGWILFAAGVVAVVAGLAGAPVAALVAGIVLIAAAGATTVMDPAPERVGPAWRRLKALLLSGLSEGGPF